MSDISNLKIGANTYGIKDRTARTTANNADNNASSAIQQSAQTEAKLANSKITGTYTQQTETLEIALEIGSINNGGGE